MLPFLLRRDFPDLPEQARPVDLLVRSHDLGQSRPDQRGGALQRLQHGPQLRRLLLGTSRVLQLHQAARRVGSLESFSSSMSRHAHHDDSEVEVRWPKLILEVDQLRNGGTLHARAPWWTTSGTMAGAAARRRPCYFTASMKSPVPSLFPTRLSRARG